MDSKSQNIIIMFNVYSKYNKNNVLFKCLKLNKKYFESSWILST